MDRYHTLQVFVAVADAGSFTRAAERLNMPRASVSAAVAQLEARLGTRLLQRTTRRVQLTADGTTHHARCVRLLAEFDAAESAFRATSTDVAGRLRVDVPSRLARLVLVPALPALLARHPRLDLDLGVTDRATDPARDGVDCVLHVGELDVGSWIERRIGSLPQGNYASPGYLERHGVPHHPSQLATHRAVRYASRSGTREAPWLYVENGAPRAVAMRGAVKVNNADTQISCALAGLGLIQVSALDVHAHLADGTLVDVMPRWRAPPAPMSVFHPNQRHVSPRVLAFADWVRELFRDHLAAGPAPAPLRLAG